MDKCAEAAISAYFRRVADGSASDAETAILPTMLEKFGELNAERLCAIADLSEAGRKGDFPSTGLVTGEEVAAFIGRKGLRHPAASLMRMAREGKFIMPANVGARPFRWEASQVRDWLAGFSGPGASARRKSGQSGHKNAAA